jgi:SAM-dependent methyltransferase
MTSSTPSDGQWPTIAAAWDLIGSPLRPVADDLALVWAAVADWSSTTSRPPRVLILGVTPELFHLPWPAGSVVRAADRTETMITLVWPGDRADAIHADWVDMRWPDGSFDLVLCDGGWHLLDLGGQRALAEKLARIVSPDGRFVVRLFVPPAKRESPETVISDLLAGRVRDMNCLKLRLGMSMTTTPEEGVELGEVWRRLHEAAGSWPALSARVGWNLDHISAIDASMRPTSAEFVTHTITMPGYLMGEQCPTVVMRKLP